ncbi:MAG: GLPGLI family protein [Cytophagales bacterium]|nr:GLPGLI family protein [Cytophagales bacterium]
MKKEQKSIVLILGVLIALFISYSSHSQEFKGMATYKSDRNMSGFQFQGEGMGPDQMEQMKAQLKKQFQREYELRFNLTESTWKEAESLDAGAASANSGGMQITISTGGGVSYKNTTEKLYLQQTEQFSKIFLIKDELEDREWKMTGKQKKIGDYTVHEAVYQNIREVQTMSMSDEGQSTETVMDTTQVVVWYTPEIPVPHGPDDFWGLPGLILEMSDGNITYLCTKVELNPAKGVEIEKPKKGKKITAEDFEKLSLEMTQKMMKKYQNHGDGEETMIMISSGG